MAIIQWRRASAAQWTTDNPVLRSGEAGVEEDTGNFKLGNGVENWSALPYFLNADEIGDQITMTDNGDGGFSLNAFKLAGYSWVNATFAKIANAVELATAAALPPGIATAGTGVDAARVDHRHPFQPTRPSFIKPAGTWISDCMKSDSATSELSAGFLGLRPMFIDTPDHQPLTIDRIGLSVTTAGSGDSTAKTGIWKAQASGYPDLTQLVVQASTPTDTTGRKQMTIANTTLQEGLYWSGTVAQGTTPAKFLAARPEEFRVVLPHLDPNSNNIFDQIYCYLVTGVTGALPTTPADISAVNNASAALIWMRVV